MSETIYRKYRPQTFAHIAGQEHITTVLKNQLIHNKLVHAYLFCGIRGVGKTTIARLLAKSLNCQSRQPNEFEPCNTCESCRAIVQGTSLDVLEIDAASNRRIDDIRELKEHIPYGPIRDSYRIVIVDEVHMLTTEAFNALLKTLEEPPAHVIFILATTEVHKLPATITSRCQKFDFHALTKKEIIARLTELAEAEKVLVDQDILLQIAELSGGSSRDAENILGKLLSIGEKHITQNSANFLLPSVNTNQAIPLLTFIINKQTAQAINLIQTYASTGGNTDLLATKILSLLRQLMFLKLNGNEKKSPDHDETNNLIELANEVSLRRIRYLLEVWLNIEHNAKLTDIAELPIEIAILSVCEDETPIEITTVKQPVTNNKIKNTPTTVLTTNKTPAETNINLIDIEKQWPELVNILKPINHSLSFIMSVSRPSKIEGQSITISFQYKLHHERVNDPKIKKIIDDAISKIIGVELTVIPILEQTPTESMDLFSNVLNVFSGRVVE